MIVQPHRLRWYEAGHNPGRCYHAQCGPIPLSIALVGTMAGQPRWSISPSVAVMPLFDDRDAAILAAETAAASLILDGLAALFGEEMRAKVTS